jgi:hypothetical protein
MNSYAAAPRSPEPNDPGKEVGCKRIPLERGNFIEFLSPA